MRTDEGKAPLEEERREAKDDDKSLDDWSRDDDG
jgi:hypothetical protein